MKETKTDTSDSNTQGGVQHGRYQDSTRGDTRGYFTTSFPREGKGGDSRYNEKFVKGVLHIP